MNIKMSTFPWTLFRTEMEISSQTDRPDFPSERAEEFHRSVQCQFQGCGGKVEEGRREEFRLS